MHDLVRDRWAKIATLTSLVAAAALLHYLIPTDTHAQHQLHIVARKLFFLPPVVAAVWFGLRGAIWTTLAVSLLFALHAVLDWPGNYMEQANQLGELVGFWVVGLIAGRLFDRERTQLELLALAHEETVTGLVAALDLREHSTGMHSQRVREYALLLADRLGVDAAQRRHIAYGALLHDVGKIAVPDHILLKPGALTDAEREVIREHPAAGYRIVRRVELTCGRPPRSSTPTMSATMVAAIRTGCSGRRFHSGRGCSRWRTSTTHSPRCVPIGRL